MTFQVINLESKNWLTSAFVETSRYTGNGTPLHSCVYETSVTKPWQNTIAFFGRYLPSPNFERPTLNGRWYDFVRVSLHEFLMAPVDRMVKKLLN